MTLKVRWNSPGVMPFLGDNEVHIWRLGTAQKDDVLDGYYYLLSDEERNKADGLFFYDDYRRYISTRFVLRMLIAHYNDIEIHKLHIGYEPNGRLIISPSFGSDLKFNVSHSQELALLAFTKGREVGVDVEYIRYIQEADKMAAKFFSKDEFVLFKSLPESERMFAFYYCWTRKEAFVKTLGEGLSIPLDGLELCNFKDDETILLYNRDVSVSEYSIQTFTPAFSYIASLVVQGTKMKVKWFNLPTSPVNQEMRNYS